MLNRRVEGVGEWKVKQLARHKGKEDHLRKNGKLNVPENPIELDKAMVGVEP